MREGIIIAINDLIIKIRRADGNTDIINLPTGIRIKINGKDGQVTSIKNGDKIKINDDGTVEVTQ